MSRLSGTRALPSPPLITFVCRLAQPMAVGYAGTAQTGTSPWSDVADTVLAFPFVLEQTTTFYKVFWANGSAAGGTSDVAIFDKDFKFIVGTGAATAGSGNTLPQVVALTATTTLPPGLYYAGMTHSATTTNQVGRWNAAARLLGLFTAFGCWKSTDAGPINLDATPVSLTTDSFPLFGLITRSGFDL